MMHKFIVRELQFDCAGSGDVLVPDTTYTDTQWSLRVRVLLNSIGVLPVFNVVIFNIQGMYDASPAYGS